MRSRPGSLYLRAELEVLFICYAEVFALVTHLCCHMCCWAVLEAPCPKLLSHTLCWAWLVELKNWTMPVRAARTLDLL